MKAIIKFFISLLDQIFIVIFVLALLIYFNASIEIMIVSLIVLVFFFLIVSYIYLPQLRQPRTGAEGLVGMKGVALESFDAEGTVMVHGERWNAVTHDTFIKKGDKITVSEVNGMILSVRK